MMTQSAAELSRISIMKFLGDFEYIAPKYGWYLLNGTTIRGHHPNRLEKFDPLSASIFEKTGLHYPSPQLHLFSERHLGLSKEDALIIMIASDKLGRTTPYPKIRTLLLETCGLDTKPIPSIRSYPYG